MSTVFSSQAYHNASDLPPEFWRVLKKNEGAANIVLPFAKKASDYAQGVGDDQLWIILHDDVSEDIVFVLSCTKGLLGNYPIFIYTPESSAQLAKDEEDGKDIADALSQLVRHLLREVPSQRVFSVFSVAYVTEKVAQILHQEHGIQPVEKPYYDATLTFCTGKTLTKSQAFLCLPGSEDLLVALRPADMSHLKGLATLCKAFSITSPPYLLDDERAEMEAKALIDDQRAWVHMIKRGDEDWEIACLVAATRESEDVTAITKVFTAEPWRGRGCAARLVYRVCQEILQKKERVVLYVGNGGSEIAAARRVYHKVGFQGLDAQSQEEVENVERWLEIGFKDTTLGYW